MPSYDERYQAFEEQDRLRRRAAARGRVALPAVVLILFGTVGLVFGVTCLIYSIRQPTVVADGVRDWIESQPPGPQKVEWQAEFKESEDGLRIDDPVDLGLYALAILLGLLMIAGGLAMRSLGSFGLALTGTIAGLIPVGGCCCCAMPVGLWALLVLTRADVKEAFAARRSHLEDDY